MPSVRQLAAIVFADIQGYTAMMEEDETTAHVIRNKFQETVERECNNHSGQVIQINGDGALCMFNSAIEAVRASIAIQHQMREIPVVPLRIGIHSGDVVVENNSAYGDGINVASRIESFATAGSIFISGKVFDEIKNQKDISAEDYGRFKLKNVKEPVNIFVITNPGLEVPEKKILEGKGQILETKKKNKLIRFAVIAFILILAVSVFSSYYILYLDKKKSSPSLKTIAVMPFKNIGATADDEYFADGICEEILTQISRIGELNVMSRSSTLPYKDTKKTMKQIGKELGVNVLLEGTVQKSNDKVRIHARLINADNNQNLWAETYDRKLEDIFVLQTEIAKQIAAALNAQLTEKEKNLFEEKRTTNLQAYDFYLRGNNAFSAAWEYGKIEELPRAIRMYEQAIKLDPLFTAPYESLVKIYLTTFWMKSDEYQSRAKEWLDKLVAVNADDAYTHRALATYRNNGERDYAGALAELNIVDKMMGNGKLTYELRAEILRSMGRIDESLYYIKKQAALFPRSPRYIASVAETFKLQRNFDSSVYYINKAIEINPDVGGLYMRKSMYYAELKGDVTTAFSILKLASSLVDSSEFDADFTYFEILQGNYDKVIRVNLTNINSMGLELQYKVVPNALAVALMYRLTGKPELAKVYFKKAYDILSVLSKENPDDFRLRSVMGVSLAGLGDKQHALEEGMLARDLMPVSKDAIIGIGPLENLALIYTLLGEQDEAIALLQQMLNMPFAWTMSNTIALYQIHYYWKPLQNNPRFKAMISHHTEQQL